ncbi:69_t:CDS:2, partial [Ambispora leptoticha]
SSSSVVRSRLHQMLVGTGTVVGGVGAAVSEESMKSLKYCLQWLHYANQHIEHQITVLREFIVNLTKQASSSSSGALINTSATSTLSSIKREVVETLRKVIEVVSKYACLPDQARAKVRTFILNLPSKWANVNRTGDHSTTPSPMSSPVLAPTATNTHPATNAIRLLSLATESLEMLKAVANIFSDTIASAEAWVARLRAVGVTSGGAAAVGEIQFDNIPQLPPRWPSQQQNGYYKPDTTVTTNGIDRKHPHIDDDDDVNDVNEYSSSESEEEDMRMPMDNINLKSHARQNGIFSTKKDVSRLYNGKQKPKSSYPEVMYNNNFTHEYGYENYRAASPTSRPRARSSLSQHPPSPSQYPEQIEYRYSQFNNTQHSHHSQSHYQQYQNLAQLPLHTHPQQNVSQDTEHATDYTEFQEQTLPHYNGFSQSSQQISTSSQPRQPPYAYQKYYELAPVIAVQPASERFSAGQRTLSLTSNSTLPSGRRSPQSFITEAPPPQTKSISGTRVS